MAVREVCAAVMERDGLVLIGRRAEGAGAGLWEFPGGKRRDGETPEGCVARNAGKSWTSCCASAIA